MVVFQKLDDSFPWIEDFIAMLRIRDLLGVPHILDSAVTPSSEFLQILFGEPFFCRGFSDDFGYLLFYSLAYGLFDKLL